MTECKKCFHINNCFRIRCPSDFTKAVKVVHDNLKDGIIKQSTYWPQEKSLMEMPPFEKEEWGDFILYYFECSDCNQLFQLSVEMYHGGGGSWQPISRGNRG